MNWRKRKKINKAISHEIRVGLRTQPCKECKDFQRRVCEVDGETCIFHRFADEDQAPLHINVFTSDAEARAINNRFKQDHFVPPACSVEIVRCTYALVEYPDGTLKKVKPEQVRFLDKE